MVNQRLNAEVEEEKEKLKEAEGEIRLLLAEKELILKEVHHRIKNNMSTVASLLSLQATLSLERATVDALEEAVNRLRSMTTLYDVLYKAPRYTEILAKDYLPPLIDDIISNFPHSGSVKVVKRVDDFILGAKKLQPLGIIVNELLTTP
jgi:two-component sensor histidine kinase